MLKFAKKSTKYFISLGHQVLSILDNKYIKRDINLKWPPIFIIGFPRSGSTLLYQLLVNSFKLAYFPNISNLFYMCPAFSVKWGLKVFPEYFSTFKSNHGFENGYLSPSEAGNIWNRWFPHEKIEGFNYTTSGYLDKKSQKAIYNLISWYQEIFDAPFISKNLKMSVRLRAIYEIFPNAIFIKCKRDLVESSLSILRIRRNKNIDWWSVMPKEIEIIKTKNEIEQVCNQVYYIEKNIREDLKLFSSSNILNINYDDLCRNPSTQMENIYKFLYRNKIYLERNENKNNALINKTNSNKSTLNKNDDFLQIQKIFKKLHL